MKNLLLAVILFCACEHESEYVSQPVNSCVWRCTQRLKCMTKFRGHNVDICIETCHDACKNGSFQ